MDFECFGHIFEKYFDNFHFEYTVMHFQKLNITFPTMKISKYFKHVGFDVTSHVVSKAHFQELFKIF